MTYKPIADYGIIGDMHTAALVGLDGSIDWLCLPDFDSPSIFAAILDENKGGSFSITSESPESQSRQFYFPETNVLITRFSDAQCVARIADFMLVHESVTPDEHEPHGRRVIRHVTGIQGASRLRLECRPAFDYARSDHTVEQVDGGVIFVPEKGPRVGLSIDGPYRVENGGIVLEFELQAGESRTFVLSSRGPGDEGLVTMTPEEGEEEFRHTTTYWRNWLSKCTYRGRWREVVYRSALTLKLLTYEPTGAIVAAPTCSLPEVIGGERNWDYRYTWLRDTAFILYAFMRIGLTDEAKAFMSFLERISAHPGPDGPLNLMYSIRGEAELTESEIPHLEGYMGSGPVRIGNGAHDQLQLDIYGEVMDSVYLYNKYGAPISYDLWSSLRKMLNWVVDNWERPDEGIWEVRGGRQHFVHSKLMCWVALDRGIRLAEKRSFPSDRQRWIEARDRIYEQIMERGWNRELGSFVQYYDSETVDASSLLMSMVFFMSPQDPRMLSTIDAIEKHLTHDSLVYRYDLEKAAPDGLAGKEGTFTICTFWLVEALTRSGRLDDARYLFERMLGYANHLGLYSEQIGVSGDLLGNFPQGFTHLGLISAAFNLDRALGRRGI